MEDSARTNQDLLAEIASLKQRIRDLEQAESQRKGTEEALEKSRMDMEAIIDNLPFLAWLKDSEGHFLAVNEPFAHSCGRPSAKEVIGKTDFDVWPKELAEAYRADDAEVMCTKQKKFVEELIVDQGLGKWFETFKAPLFDVEGKVTGTTGLARDISERKWAEDALKKSEKMLLRAQELGQMGSWEWDIATNETFWSVETFKIYGLDPEKDKIDYDLVVDTLAPECKDRFLKDIEAALNYDVPFDHEYNIMRPDGTRRFTHKRGEVIRGALGNPLRMFGMVQDITERKRTEAELVRLRQAVDTSGEAIFLTDREGLITYVNPRFSQLYGYETAEVVGKVTPRILKSGKMEAQRYKAFWQALLSKQTAKCEFVNKTKDGRFLAVEGSASPILDQNGEIVGFLSIQRDVTDRKRMQEELLHAQRLEMAGRVAAQVAHDLNNLLVPLTAYPEFIKRHLPPGHSAARYCEIMIRSAKQMADIVTELLALGRRGHVSFEPTDLNLLIQDALAQLPPPAPGLIMDLDLAEDLLPVRGVSAQLTRVIVNLLTNARDALRDTGLIRVKTENCHVDQSAAQFPRVPVGEHVRLQVKDSGCGIPAEALSQIFDPFYTTKRTDQKRGSGLGITVVQAIVADHNGFIDVESQLGVGTTFSVYLPVSRDAVESIDDRPGPQGIGLILVVEDDEVQRVAAEQMLQTLGYEVEVAASGEAALDYIRKREVDLVLLDMVMPGGIDGTETYRRMLAIHPEQKAIVLSGFAETERVQEALRLGVTLFLRKPVSYQDLARVVSEILSR